MITIKRKGLTLYCDKQIIPAQGSANVPVALENDDTFTDYAIVAKVSWVNGFTVKSEPRPYIDGKFTIPLDAFQHPGAIRIAIDLIKGEEIQSTQQIKFNVSPAPNGTVIIPIDQTWAEIVEYYVGKLWTDKYDADMQNYLNDFKNITIENHDLQKVINKKITEFNEQMNDLNSKIENGDFIPDFGIGNVETGNTSQVTITGPKSSPLLDFILEKGDKGISLRIKGLWNADIAYVYDENYIDLVMYEGSSYACIQSHTSNQDITPLNDQYWQLFAEKGNPNTLTIGTVEKGDVASAEITGEAPNQVLNIVLPKGDKGDKGDPNSLAIGSVTAGNTASVEITGEAPNQVLNITLPKGDKGEKGDRGERGVNNNLISVTQTDVNGNAIIVLDKVAELKQGDIFSFVLQNDAVNPSLKLEENDLTYQIKDTNNKIVDKLIGGVCYTVTYASSYFFINSGGGGTQVNGIIESYLVKSDGNVSAGDFVSYMKEFDKINKQNIDVSTKYGSQSSSIALNNSRVMLLYIDSTGYFIYATVCSFLKDSIVVGAPFKVCDVQYASYNFIVRLDDYNGIERILIGFRNSSNTLSTIVVMIDGLYVYAEETELVITDVVESWNGSNAIKISGDTVFISTSGDKSIRNLCGVICKVEAGHITKGEIYRLNYYESSLVYCKLQYDFSKNILYTLYKTSGNLCLQAYTIDGLVITTCSSELSVGQTDSSNYTFSAKLIDSATILIVFFSKNYNAISYRIYELTETQGEISFKGKNVRTIESDSYQEIDYLYAKGSNVYLTFKKNRSHTMTAAFGVLDDSSAGLTFNKYTTIIEDKSNTEINKVFDYFEVEENKIMVLYEQDNKIYATVFDHDGNTENLILFDDNSSYYYGFSAMKINENKFFIAYSPKTSSFFEVFIGEIKDTVFKYNYGKIFGIAKNSGISGNTIDVIVPK